MQHTPPAYGRFVYPGPVELIENLRFISKQVMHDQPFSAYLMGRDGSGLYGLSLEELESTWLAEPERFNTLSASCLAEDGRSLSVKIRFGESSGEADAQYVVAVESRYLRRQVVDMLHGRYEAPGPEWIEKQKLIAELMRELLAYRQAQQAREKREDAKAKKETTTRESDPNQNGKAAQEISPPSLASLRDDFAVRSDIDVEVLNKLSTRISKGYLNKAPFNNRVIDREGNSYNDLNRQELSEVYQQIGPKIYKVILDAATDQGDWVDITLVFSGEEKSIRAEIEIISEDAKAIQQDIRDALARIERDIQFSDLPVYRERFTWQGRQIPASHLQRAFIDLSARYFDRVTPLAYLHTIDGDQFNGLNPGRLAHLLPLVKGQMGELRLQVFSEHLHRGVELRFQRPEKGVGSGLLSIWEGDPDLRRQIRDRLFEDLALLPQREKDQAVKGTGKMPVTPVFQGRGYKHQTLTALVVMPLEAYWSEPLWVHLQQTLLSLGYSTERAASPYDREVLEHNWQLLNEHEVVIADLTYKHPGVFFLLGVAQTLGKRCILISQHARDIPVDFQRFAHVVYDNSLSGLQRLASQVLEILQEKS